MDVGNRKKIEITYCYTIIYEGAKPMSDENIVPKMKQQERYFAVITFDKEMKSLTGV